jgi:hypothetical protein
MVFNGELKAFGGHWLPQKYGPMMKHRRLQAEKYLASWRPSNRFRVGT